MMKCWCFRPLLCTLFRLNWAKQTPGDNEAKLMTKLAPEWVRTSDPVIRSPACYRWTTAPPRLEVQGAPKTITNKRFDLTKLLLVVFSENDFEDGYPLNLDITTIAKY